MTPRPPLSSSLLSPSKIHHVLLLLLICLSDTHFSFSMLFFFSINCVVELMGGTTTAKDVVFRAIAAGKHVVTANKALIAAFLPELMALLKANPTVSFNYEVITVHLQHTSKFTSDRHTYRSSVSTSSLFLTHPYFHTEPCIIVYLNDVL